MSEQPVEQRVRERKKTLGVDHSTFGMGVVVVGLVMLIVPILVTQTIEVVPAIVGAGVVVVGGIFADPKHFVRIGERMIDALPGGKH